MRQIQASSEKKTVQLEYSQSPHQNPKASMASNNYDQNQGNNSFCEEIGSSQFENPNAAMRKFMQGLKDPSNKSHTYNTAQPSKQQPGLVLDPSFKDLPRELVLEENSNSN